jgi:hypothetical protein
MPATGHCVALSSFSGKSILAISDDPLTGSRRVQGYAVFLSGNWNTATFIFNYGIVSVPQVVKVPVRETNIVLDRSGWQYWSRLEAIQENTVPPCIGCRLGLASILL